MFKKIYLTLLSIILLVITFGTSTYAWVTISTTNRVDALGINATLGDRLEVSIDGTDYYSELSGKMIMDQIRKVRFTDVTSLDGITFEKGIQERLKEAEVNEDYISMSLFFRTTSQYRNVYLIDNMSQGADYSNPPENGTYVISKGIGFKAKFKFLYDVDEYIEAGETRTFYAKDAMRIAFIEETVDEVLDTRRNDELIKYIYDPSEDEHRGYGKEYGNLDYYNLVKDKKLDLPLEIPETRYSLSTFANYNPNVALNDNSKIMTLIATNEFDQYERRYYEGKVTIKIWLEGWDADMFDGVYRDNVKIQLMFKLGKAEIN